MSGDHLRRRPSPYPRPSPGPQPSPDAQPDTALLGDRFGTSVAPPVAPPPVGPQWVSPEYQS